MSVELWFLLTLALAQLYDVRASREFELMSAGRKFGLGMAAVAAILIAGLALLLYSVDLTHVGGMRDTRSIWMLLGAFISYQGSRLGLRYWLPQVWWQRTGSCGVAALTTLSFFAQPIFTTPDVFNNLLLMFFSIGVGTLIGHWVSKSFTYFFYTLLLLFDVYAVWFSDIMVTMVGRAPNVVPSGFIILATVLGQDFLGAGDVIFGVVGVITLRVYCGWRWALGASLLYVVMLTDQFLRLLPLEWLSRIGLFPVMVTICPVTMLFLWLGSYRVSRPCS